MPATTPRPTYRSCDFPVISGAQNSVFAIYLWHPPTETKTYELRRVTVGMYGGGGAAGLLNLTLYAIDGIASPEGGYRNYFSRLSLADPMIEADGVNGYVQVGAHPPQLESNGQMATAYLNLADGPGATTFEFGADALTEPFMMLPGQGRGLSLAAFNQTALVPPTGGNLQFGYLMEFWVY